MNKVLVGGGVIVVALASWWFFMSSTTVTYVASFTHEVEALEAELAEIEEQVVAGTLTPEVAAAAQLRIATRLNAISTASTEAVAANLTPDQRAQLLAGLEKLKQILIAYQDTLQTVDEQTNALATADRVDAGRVNRGVRLLAVSTIAELSEQLAVEPEVGVITDTSVTTSETLGDIPMTEIDVTEIDAVEEIEIDESTETAATASVVGPEVPSETEVE